MPSTDRPVMGFLTDFGLDGAAATCRAVMLSICRDAQIVDIAHTIRKYAIRDGAGVVQGTLQTAVMKPVLEGRDREVRQAILKSTGGKASGGTTI